MVFNVTTWSMMQSTDSNEHEILDLMIDFNYQQHFPTVKVKLDIVLCNPTDLILDTKIDLKLNSPISQQGKNLSDHNFSK